MNFCLNFERSDQYISVLSVISVRLNKICEICEICVPLNSQLNTEEPAHQLHGHTAASGIVGELHLINLPHIEVP